MRPPTMVTVAAWPRMVAEGRPMRDSPEVKLTVTVFPVLARAELALFEAMVTGVNVGAVRSKLTEEALVVAVTWVPALPAASVKLMVKGTGPSVSVTSRV